MKLVSKRNMNSITMEWINGRSLCSYSDSSKDLDIVYEYDVNGIRTSKIVNGNSTKYYLENSNIIYEERGTDTLYYLYDLTGLIGIKYNDVVYYYIKNLQEDIIGILDSSYNRIVTYEYDSWGKVVSIKDQEGNEITNPNHIGIMNPFRYRGYYYDVETKLYYLNSRYYNPEWGRFINADGIIGANQDILGYNLYAYASNNPINNSDTSGNGLFNNVFKFAIKVQKGIHDLKKNIYNTINNISKQFGNILKPIKENFVIESGKGKGGKLKTATKVIGGLNISKEDNITYKNNEFTCSETTTEGLELGFVKFAKEETIKTDCYNGTTISKSQIVETITLGPITWNTNGDLFFGLSFDVNLYIISGHIKIGWDIPSQKRKIMPGADYSSFRIY